MKFEFAKYTEVTETAKKLNSAYENSGVIRVFICPDTNNLWLARLYKDLNSEFEKSEGTYLVERDRIDYPTTYNHFIKSDEYVAILEEDSFDGWDNQEYESEEDAIEDLDGGFGIIPENAT